MSVTCLVPRPERVHAMYVVMTAEKIEPEGNAPLPDERLLRLRGATPEQLEQLNARPYQHVISGEAELDQAVTMQRNTRERAVTTAAEYDGLVIDLRIPAVIPLMRKVSMTASHWIGFDYSGINDGHITVVGLSAFGLPDVAVTGVDRERHAMYTAMATGLAQRMIDEWPAHDPIGTATVTLRDIAFGLGDEHAGNTPVSRGVEVTIYYADDECLHVSAGEDLASALFS